MGEKSALRHPAADFNQLLDVAPLAAPGHVGDEVGHFLGLDEDDLYERGLE